MMDATSSQQQHLSPPLYTVDDLIFQRAQDCGDEPLLAFPASERGLTDFEHFTGRDLDRFTDAAAKKFLSLGFQSAADNPAPVVALLGHSTFSYMVTMLGLSRLGYAVFLLSPRLSVNACVSLLGSANCRTMIYQPSFEHMIRGVQEQRSVSLYTVLSRSDYDIEESMSDDRFCLQIDERVAPNRIAYIMHSSGSTGLPKLIHQTHQACLENFVFGYGTRGFSTAPLFHTYGHATLFRSIYTRGTLYMYNTNVPLTSHNLTSVLENVKPEVLFAVPYVLKLIAESQRGLDTLRACGTVTSSGSACPDELGILLAENDIHYVTSLGLTETGVLMSSKRERGDKTWDYMRILPSVKPYIMMKPISNDVYELIVLDGLKSKSTSNSDDPPNSFHTRDIFSPHPTLPDAWKYLGRLDDRVTLANGEKVLPLPIEGRLRQDANIREAVVFGIGRDIPGVLAFRSEKARALSDDDFMSAIWPAVEDTNSRAEGFSQISRDMIVPMSADVQCPQTDKSTIIRAQVYKVFADQINRCYERLQSRAGGSMRLEEDELRKFLSDVLSHRLGIQVDGPDTDLFAAGLDSLRAIQLVAEIKRDLYLAGRDGEVNQNSIYEKQTVARLARYLHALQTDMHIPDDNEELEVSSLVQKYSIFSKPHADVPAPPQGWTVVLTGATGSLGAHILAQLLPREDIERVFCLVRVGSAQLPLQRILSSLNTRYIDIPEQLLRGKVTGIAGDFSLPSLGMPPDVIQRLQKSRCLIIHAAWEVNFNLALASFEKESIAGTKYLLDLLLSLQTAMQSRFVFCSSISTAANSPPGTTVTEQAVENMAYAQATGYARSKLVAEYIAQAAAKASADVRVLRIGQIVGDSIHGVWNDHEAIPLMIRSARTVSALPQLDQRCSWLPVDRCAAVVLELAGLGPSNSEMLTASSTLPQAQFYNVLHPISFDWTHELLPALRASGMKFDAVPVREWLERLERSDPDPKNNPSVKLLRFWQERYGTGGSHENKETVRFSTVKAQRDSVALQEAQDCISSGLVGKFVRQWLKTWSM